MNRNRFCRGADRVGDFLGRYVSLLPFFSPFLWSLVRRSRWFSFFSHIALRVPLIHSQTAAFSVGQSQSSRALSQFVIWGHSRLSESALIAAPMWPVG